MDRALLQGGWLVLLFHGVGGDHMAVESEAHRALLEHLGPQRDVIWTDCFGSVAAHVRSNRPAI